MIIANEIVTGDIIEFIEDVFNGTQYTNGDRRIRALVLRENYSPLRMQHSYTLGVLGSGSRQLEVVKIITRKSRNIGRRGVSREIWLNETERNALCEEKKQRRAKARQKQREERRMRRRAITAEVIANVLQQENIY